MSTRVLSIYYLSIAAVAKCRYGSIPKMLKAKQNFYILNVTSSLALLFLMVSLEVLTLHRRGYWEMQNWIILRLTLLVLRLDRHMDQIWKGIFVGLKRSGNAHKTGHRSSWSRLSRSRLSTSTYKKMLFENLLPMSSISNCCKFSLGVLSTHHSDNR